MAGINYAGDYLNLTLSPYPPILNGIQDYDLDRTRLQKVYSYVRSKQKWVFRVSDDPPVYGEFQGRTLPRE